MSFVPTEYLKDQQNIERNSPPVLECENCDKISKVAHSIRWHIGLHIFSMMVCCRYTVIYSAIPNKRELH